MKVTRKIIQIDEELCDGCGNCVPGCAEGALQIIDGKARMVADHFCDGLGACLGDCPTGALKIIEREADEFDEAAVEVHLASIAKQAPETSAPAPSGCPSANIEMLTPESACNCANEAASFTADQASALSHWPIQIRLVPPGAPFLKGASLLIVADCVSVAFPSLHRDFLKDKAVMMGCPKFDDVDMYIEKFAGVFSEANIKDITTLIMEVPCCSSMNGIIKQAIERSGKNVPVEQITISTQGAEIERKTW
jgi:NAD-dependent dihydropyrimidine dehydrogenase PreA subunit